MIEAKQLLNEIAKALRNVIAPAITEPYPKAQAFMAAVIIEFVARQVRKAKSDVAEGKQEAMVSLGNFRASQQRIISGKGVLPARLV